MDIELSSSAVERVASCLRMGIGELDWLSPIKIHSEKRVPEKWGVVGFDTNALKHLRRISPLARSTSINFLQANEIPIILPAQAVQEFWNNHRVFAKSFSDLEGDTRKLAQRFGRADGGKGKHNRLLAIADEIDKMAAELVDDANPDLLAESVSLMEALLELATVSCMPRASILNIGNERLSSEVAPGFADADKAKNVLGDFLVWSDFLYGLELLRDHLSERSDEAVVFVSDDAKEDWVTSGVPHPTLLGEVYRLTQLPLVIVSSKAFEAVASGGVLESKVISKVTIPERVTNSR